MGLKRIPPVMVKAHPPLTPIKTSMEEIIRAKEIARRIAGRK